MKSVPVAVWLGESYQVLGDVKASKQWWEVACEECQEAFNPAATDYWLGRALVGLGDKSGTRRAYEGVSRAWGGGGNFGEA